jgi:hypothetical protein
MPLITTSNSCGADTEAKRIFESIVDEDKFAIPEIDFDSDDFKIPSKNGNPLYEDPAPITLEALTTGVINGTGVFDVVMSTIQAHLQREFQNQRISGREFADVYTASMGAAMSQAVTFLLGKDAAQWQARLIQAQARQAEIDAVTARVRLEIAKIEHLTMNIQAQTAMSQYAGQKMQLSLMDADYCIKLMEKAGLTLDVAAKEFTNTNMLPQQLNMILGQVEMIGLQNTGLIADNFTKEYSNTHILPYTALITQRNAEGVRIDNETKDYTLTYILPKQLVLVTEQGEVQRAQTLNNRSDGTPVSGLIGKQKELYTQQIISYQRDAEVKAAKMFIDTWVTQKTIDEGLIAPHALRNAAINTIMTRIIETNELGDIGEPEPDPDPDPDP